MKKFTCLGLLFFFSLFGCAREKPYVTVEKTPPTKKVALPETREGEIPKPYVINGQRYYPLSDAVGFVEVGKASWYGEKFHGRPTASGEVYNMYEISAAHRTLPLGTYVQVQNLTNEKSTVLRINDRGPFAKGRILDLSYGAAKELGVVGPGTTDVKIVAMGREAGELKVGKKSTLLLEFEDPRMGEFTIQVGAFVKKENAVKLADRLRVIFDYVNINIFLDENRRTLHRVHVSKSKTLGQAGEMEKKIEDLGFMDAFIVRI